MLVGAALFGALGRGGAQDSAREHQWQKGSQTLTKGRSERSRAPSRPHADGPTRGAAGSLARARRASVRPCRASCAGKPDKNPKLRIREYDDTGNFGGKTSRRINKYVDFAKEAGGGPSTGQINRATIEKGS